MIPHGAYCCGVCVYTHMYKRFPRGKKKHVWKCKEVMEGTGGYGMSSWVWPQFSKRKSCTNMEHMVGAQWMFITLEGLPLSSAPAMWVMLKASTWVWKQENVSREREKNWKGRVFAGKRPVSTLGGGGTNWKIRQPYHRGKRNVGRDVSEGWDALMSVHLLAAGQCGDSGQIFPDFTS